MAVRIDAVATKRKQRWWVSQEKELNFSPNFDKILCRIQRLHEEIANIMCFCHKETRRLVFQQFAKKTLVYTLHDQNKKLYQKNILSCTCRPYFLSEPWLKNFVQEPMQLTSPISLVQILEQCSVGCCCGQWD